MIRFAAAGLIACAAGQAFAQQASFRGLGNPPGMPTEATAISADGLVIVGGRYDPVGGFNEPIKWTAATGVVLIAPGTHGVAMATSSDGSVIVGTLAGTMHAFRWTAAGLVDINGSQPSSGATGVSGDGSVVVGSGGGGLVAWRWTQSTGIVSLGDFPGGVFDSDASGVSKDGQVIVGSGHSAAGGEAFRWTESTGLVALGHLTPSATFARAHAASADGSVIAGFDEPAGGGLWQPFRWTQATGMVALGLLSGSAPFGGRANAISADGSVIVGGNYVTCNQQAAFRWIAGSGSQRITDLLRAQGVTSVTGWQLEAATGISADGTVIVGTGYNPSGQGEGWIAVLPATNLPAPPCYADCDQCGTLTANDFQCFLNKFAQHDPYANCDGSTANPLFTANDFQCFLNNYATGCF